MNNIVTDFREKNPASQIWSGKVDPALFESADAAEKKLLELFQALSEKISRANPDSAAYLDIFDFISKAKPSVDLFFDTVMVMHEDEKIRNNRILLLDCLVSAVKKLLDLSHLQ
jgi:glycyl-tRNA synthetase beta chain